MSRIERLNALSVECLLVSGRRDRAVAWYQERLAIPPSWGYEPPDPPAREELQASIARLRFMLEVAS